MTSSRHQRDTTFTKIFVGGLPYHTTSETLQKFFEPFGNIKEAVVITERQTGKSRGYGFVTMSDRAAAERACKEPNPIIDGRKANVNLAYLGAKPRIPVGELIASFPFGLEGGLTSATYPGPEIVGYPQLIYPPAYLSNVPQGNPLTLTQPQIVHRTVNPTQLIDYMAILGTPTVPLYQDAVKLTAYPHLASTTTIEGGYHAAAPSATPTVPALALVRPGVTPSAQTLIAVSSLQPVMDADPRWLQDKGYLG